MIKVDVRLELKAFEAQMNSLQRRQLPYATALSLTRTAKFAERKVREEIGRVFDRPTKFTQNATFVTPATKQRLWAEVKIKDESVKAVAAIKWLAPQIYGGTRSFKRFEGLLKARGILPAGMYAVPGQGARMDAYGNMSRGQITQILSRLGASRDPLSNQTARSKRSRRNGDEYFALSVRRGRLGPGIYQRISYAEHFGKSAGRQGTGGGSKVMPVMVFVPRARYRRRLRFYEVAEQSAQMRWPIEFALAMRDALRTAR